MLQGKAAEAEKDFGESIKANRQGKIFLDHYLKSLEVRIKEFRKRQAETQKRTF